MDRYLTVSEARQRFLQLVDETVEGNQVIVTKRGKPAVVLIDFERLETLKRVTQLLQAPGALKAMQEAIADSEAGRVLQMDKVPSVAELVRTAREKGLVRLPTPLDCQRATT